MCDKQITKSHFLSFLKKSAYCCAISMGSRYLVSLYCFLPTKPSNSIPTAKIPTLIPSLLKILYFSVFPSKMVLLKS